MLTLTAILLFLLIICVTALVRSVLDHARVVPPSKIHAITDLLALRKYHHEKIEAHMQDLYALQSEWVALHSEELNSYQGDELSTFWLCASEDYESTIHRCNRMRANQ